MAIQLTQSDIDRITERLNSGQNNQPNYADMYQYIFDTYGSQMEGKQKYWFKEAANINLYLNYVYNPTAYPQPIEPTQSAYFIQQMNKESLRLSSLDYSDKKIQEITNTIAKNVYNDIVNGNHIPDMTTQVNNDIKAAIEVGGLNVSQWGGAFYFWDMKLPSTNNVKLGKYIVDDGKLDQFIEMTSISMAKTIDKFKLQGDGSVEAVWGAIETFSYGYSDGLNPIALLTLPINVPLSVVLVPQSDQWVGLKLVYETLKRSEIVREKFNHFKEIVFEDFVEYIIDSHKILDTSIETALNNLFNDTAIGTEKNDNLNGGLFIGIGNDKLFGLGGNDTLDGGSGNDLLVGGKGFDTYHIEDHDTVYDSDGQGKLIFEGGWLSKDVEFSQAFEDTLNETWAYKVKGKTTHRAYKDGKDLIIMDLNNDHQVTVKDFFDVAVYQNNAYSALNIQLPSKPLNPDDEKYNIISANPDYVANIYASGSKQLKIFGSNQDDNIFANNRDLASIIKAGDGHDSVFGSNSKDEIFGGAGNDVLYGSSGFLDFATANVPEEDHDIIIGNEGYDLISAGVGDDVIYVDEKRSHLIQDSSNRHGDWALGGKGDDTIHGGVGRDFLQGGVGADVVFAGSGDDVILGDGHIRFGVKSKTRYDLDTINSGYTNVGSGIHSLVGGVLSPTVSVTKGDTLSIEYRITNKDGKEILDIQEQQSAYTRDNKTFDWDIETIQDGLDYFIRTHQEVPLSYNHHALESDNAHDILYGGLGNDLIIGQYGNDTLFGGEGNDILFGDDNRDLTITGNDTLNGGKGNDKLYGGRGSDYLIASEGQDILDGGDDYDFYIFDYPALQDGLDKTIVDKQGKGQLSIAGTDWASKTWLNIDLNDKNNPDPYLAQDSALRSRLQDAPTWTDGTGSFIQVVGGELHIISRYFNSKIMIQSDEIQLGDGQTESRLPFNFKLESAKKNTAPEVANQYDDQLVTAGQAFSLLLSNDLFNDADGDELNYQVSLANGQPLPTWLQFDANSKTLSGTAPSQSQVALKITATDPDGETAEQTFNLRTNSAPEVANQYSDQVVIADKVFNFALPNDLFNDADGDELNYQVSLANGQALPTWLQFDANSKTLSGTAPSQSQVALKITATDNYGETAEQTFNLRTNSAPELAEAFSPQYIVQPQRARQQVWTYQTAKHFKDIDQDQLQYSVHIKSAPSGITSQAVSINSSTGVLSLNQSFLQAGKYQLDITATDPHGQSYTATADINIVAPVSNPIAHTSHHSADIFSNIGFQQPSLFNPVRQAKGGETHGYFFNDNIQGIANKAHQISGKAGNDKLYGANLNDVLSGDAGHDTLYGLQGNDTLSGGLGNDILVGGQGNDVLIGGDGNDMYFYQRGDGLDYLIDNKGVDTLDLSSGRISLNEVLLKLDESNTNNAIVSFKYHQPTSNENEQLYIENWANAIEYIKTTEGIFDFKQLMQTVI